MTQTIVLITGANRGIGRGLLELYLLRTNHLVIAANRDPAHPTSKELDGLPKGEGTSLLIIKNDSTIETDAAAAVATLITKGITHIDILIANAGVAYSFPRVSEVKTEEMQRHFVPNVYGNVWLYQAVLPLLKKSEKKIWVTVGSSAAYLTITTRNMLSTSNAAYAPSKLVMHWLTKAIHQEEPELIAFPLDPGFVQTKLGNDAANLMGLEKATITTEESVEGMIKVIDVATRETHGGKLWTYEGKEVVW